MAHCGARVIWCEPSVQVVTSVALVVFVSQATERPEHVAACVACGKEAVRECSNAVRWEVRTALCCGADCGD